MRSRGARGTRAGEDLDARPRDLALAVVGEADLRPRGLEVVEVLGVDPREALGLQRLADERQRGRRGVAGVVPAAEGADDRWGAKSVGTALPDQRLHPIQGTSWADAVDHRFDDDRRDAARRPGGRRRSSPARARTASCRAAARRTSPSSCATAPARSRVARFATPTSWPGASSAATSCTSPGASSASATSCRSSCARSAARPPATSTRPRSCRSPTATSTSSTASSSTSRARSTTPACSALLARAARRRRAARAVAPRAVHAQRPPRLPRRPARAHRRRRDARARGLPAAPAPGLRPARRRGARPRPRQDARVHVRRGDRRDRRRAACSGTSSSGSRSCATARRASTQLDSAPLHRARALRADATTAPTPAPGRRFGSAEALALYRLNALDASVKDALEHGLGAAEACAGGARDQLGCARMPRARPAAVGRAARAARLRRRRASASQHGHAGRRRGPRAGVQRRRARRRPRAARAAGSCSSASSPGSPAQTILATALRDDDDEVVARGVRAGARAGLEARRRRRASGPASVMVGAAGRPAARGRDVRRRRSIVVARRGRRRAHRLARGRLRRAARSTPNTRDAVGDRRSAAPTARAPRAPQGAERGPPAGGARPRRRATPGSPACCGRRSSGSTARCVPFSPAGLGAAIAAERDSVLVPVGILADGTRVVLLGGIERGATTATSKQVVHGRARRDAAPAGPARRLPRSSPSWPRTAPAARPAGGRRSDPGVRRHAGTRRAADTVSLVSVRGDGGDRRELVQGTLPQAVGRRGRRRPRRVVAAALRGRARDRRPAGPGAARHGWRPAAPRSSRAARRLRGRQDRRARALPGRLQRRRLSGRLCAAGTREFSFDAGTHVVRLPVSRSDAAAAPACASTCSSRTARSRP